MLILVGLGNPGPKYAGNRHNVGYMAADEIVRRYDLQSTRARFSSKVFEGVVGGEKVILLKPTTFMNRSGQAAWSALRLYKLKARDVIVIYDDLDLVPGKVRAKRGGGNGGHNGLKSLESRIGKDYRRIRIGIGHPGNKHKVESYVLHDFEKEERPVVEKTIDAVAEALPILIEGDDPGFMTKVALLNPPPKKPKPEPKPKPEAAADGGRNGQEAP